VFSGKPVTHGLYGRGQQRYECRLDSSFFLAEFDGHIFLDFETGNQVAELPTDS